MTAPELKRCAVYTRKSHEDGLEQEFNSLHAQREACEAYIKSQAHEGWRALDTVYDDGGFSGGSMERPSLKKLLADITHGRIDIVVCYKLDRLSRSLPDFARMVELFDKHEVSFVSITQQFSTTKSMGRLTLNMLLSFAQFEREITGERIRDKIAASKAKGLWMGGVLPLGYDLPKEGSRVLRVNLGEADRVRLIYRKYLELRSVHALCDWLNGQGIGPKRWVAASGKKIGAATFSRGALFHLLRNPVYRGMIRHKGLLHEGGHEAIVDQSLFEKVQLGLNEAANRHKEKNNLVARAPLTGKLFDAAGEAMSPTFSHGRRGKVYRYYVSTSLQKGGAPAKDQELVQRVPANAIENQVRDAVSRLVPRKGGDPLADVERVEIHRGATHLLLPSAKCGGIDERLASDEVVVSQGSPERRRSMHRIRLPLRIRNRRGRTVINRGTAPSLRRDSTLIAALRKAHSMISLDTRHLPTCDTSPPTQYERRLVRLALLAPDIQAAIMDGKQPEAINLEQLIRNPIPLSWEEQRAMFCDGDVPSADADILDADAEDADAHGIDTQDASADADAGNPDTPDADTQRPDVVSDADAGKELQTLCPDADAPDADIPDVSTNGLDASADKRNRTDRSDAAGPDTSLNRSFVKATADAEVRTFRTRPRTRKAAPFPRQPG